MGVDCSRCMHQRRRHVTASGEQQGGTAVGSAYCPAPVQRDSHLSERVEQPLRLRMQAEADQCLDIVWHEGDVCRLVQTDPLSRRDRRSQEGVRGRGVAEAQVHEAKGRAVAQGGQRQVKPVRYRQAFRRTLHRELDVSGQRGGLRPYVQRLAAKPIVSRRGEQALFRMGQGTPRVTHPQLEPSEAPGQVLTRVLPTLSEESSGFS
jgi:hypothetical protein